MKNIVIITFLMVGVLWVFSVLMDSAMADVTSSGSTTNDHQLSRW